MKYKINDRVRIKSLDWYNENKDEDGIVELSTHVFVPGMSQFCGKIMTIEDVFEDIEDNAIYYMKEIDYDWTDEMIEGLAEDTITINEQLFKPSNISLEKEMEWNLPNGYVFKDENGNVINATKIVLEKKKKEYPKTYEECLKILNIDDDAYIYIIAPLSALTRLLICRDAYWKIAGEEMGLGKPWKPDWADYEQKKFVFVVEGNTLIEKEYTIQSCILAFPTEEMRDAFKENFDPDIEFCKELL